MAGRWVGGQAGRRAGGMGNDCRLAIADCRFLQLYEGRCAEILLPTHHTPLPRTLHEKKP